MKETGILIQGVEYKIRKLLSRYEKLKESNETIQSDFQSLKQEIEEKNKLIDELKQEIQKIKLAKSLESNEGPNEAKIKINELVREIDNCIGLLNQ
jgi:peptidoglycan hydrolase CwlO-like protein